jgi:glycosyltransferase involved in cell wall biosynthesis
LVTSPNEGFEVTIGVCVKDCENLVREAIESIADQDFPHRFMEVVIVDDGSKDRTLSIVEDCVAKMDISARIFHQKWRGLGYARNVVVDNARGKYIIWVDGDMKLTKGFVRKQVDFMERNPIVAIGKGKYGICATNVVGTLENLEFMTANSRSREKIGSRPLGTGGSIYRVNAIREVGGFDQNIQGSGEDADAEHRIKEAGWLLDTTSAVFYERRRKTWKLLWDEYFWHGTGGPHIIEKNGRFADPYMFFPPFAVLMEFSRVASAYKISHHRLALLLPLHYTFKRVAWVLGFAKNLFISGRTRSSLDGRNHADPSVY